MVEPIAPHPLVEEEAISEEFNDSFKEFLVAQGPQDVLHLETLILSRYVLSLHKCNNLLLPVGLPVLKDVQEGHRFDN